jgi:DNA-directed RNA polymerase specialized sigma24 family protein
MPPNPDEPSPEEVARTALDALYAEDFAGVVQFVMYNGSTLQDAQDAANEAFLEAHKSVANGTWHQVESPGGWVRNVALRRWRRPPHSRKSVFADPIADPHGPSVGHHPQELADETLDVLAALRRLEPAPRAVIAFDMDGYSVAETAKALGMSYVSVTRLRAKAKADLRRYLADEGRAR